MASDHPPSLRGDEQDLFRSFNERLLRSVRRSVNAPQVIIEEGCGFAWQRLIECQPERSERIFGWLRTVAVHEAWRLARRERVAVRLDEPAAVDGGLLVHELVANERLSLDGQLDALAALVLVASLPARQRDFARAPDRRFQLRGDERDHGRLGQDRRSPAASRARARSRSLPGVVAISGGRLSGVVRKAT